MASATPATQAKSKVAPDRADRDRSNFNFPKPPPPPGPRRPFDWKKDRWEW